MNLIMLIFLGDESPALRNLHGYQNVLNNIFVYWKSKKLEEDLVLVVEWNVSFSKNVGLQGRTLLNITLFPRVLFTFYNKADGRKSRNTPDTTDFCLENKVF